MQYFCIFHNIAYSHCCSDIIMPLIMPIKDLRNTTESSNIAHKEQEPIFMTQNGYSDLVVMSSELYDKFARMNRIDQAIFESEQ